MQSTLQLDNKRDTRYKLEVASFSHKIKCQFTTDTVYGTTKSVSVHDTQHTLNWILSTGQAAHSPRLCRGSLQRWRAVSRKWRFLEITTNWLPTVKWSPVRNNAFYCMLTKNQSHLTCALWWLSAHCEGSSQDPNQRRGQLHASSTPTVKPGPQQNGKVSHLQTMTQQRNG